MNNIDLTELAIAAMPIRDLVPKDKPLVERIKFAMSYIRKHKDEVFWMSYQVNDDKQIRTALAAVMMAGSDEDRILIKRSIKPLQMLSAAIQGIPVNFGAMETSEDLIPLIKLWHESEKDIGL